MIPVDFDGNKDDNEKGQQPMENVQLPSIPENTPADTQILPTDAADDEHRPQRARRRPAWMTNYEVTRIEQS